MCRKMPIERNPAEIWIAPLSPVGMSAESGRTNAQLRARPAVGPARARRHRQPLFDEQGSDQGDINLTFGLRRPPPIILCIARQLENAVSRSSIDPSA